MKKAYLISLLVIVSLGFLQAQSPTFQTISTNSFGGSVGEEFFQASQTSDGGFLISGLSESQDGDVNQSTVYDTSNIFIVKCDSLGSKQWARSYGGNDYDKGRYGMEDSQGNYLITGTTISKDGQVVSSYNNADVFIMKLNPAGDVIWLHTYGGNGGESSRFILEDPDGNYLVGAYTTSPGGDVASSNFRGNFDGWIFKTDSAGNMLWSKTYGGTAQERLRFLHPTADGGYVFGGSTASADFDCVGNHGDHDFWFARIDSQGNLLWSRVYGGSGSDMAYHVTLAPDSTWLISGYTSSNDGDVVGYRGGTSDGWVIRVDNSGNLIQQKCFGGTGSDRLYRTLVLGNGEILVAGFAQSNDLDIAGTNPGGTNSYWIASLDSTLQWKWSHCEGGTAGDYGKEIFFYESDGSIVIMGDSNSSDGPASSSHGDYDYLFIRLKPIFQPTVTPSGSVNICSGGGSVELSTSPFPGATYQWLKNGVPLVGAQSNKLMVNITGNYSVTVTQLSGVSLTTAPTSVGISSLPTAAINSSGSTAFCSGGNVTLTANAGTGFQYQWKRYGVNVTNGTGQNLVVNKTGSYKCVVTNASGCARTSNTIDVTVYALPTTTISALGSTQICVGDSVGLSSTTTPGLTYQWKKYGASISGANSPVYHAKTAGSYKCTVMNSNGCTKSSNTINVNVVCKMSDLNSFDQINIQSSNGDIVITGIDPIYWAQTNLQVIDLAGRTVLHLDGISSNHIQTNGVIQPGIYFVSLVVKDKCYAEKISIR